MGSRDWGPRGWAGTGWGRWVGLVTAVWVQCASGNNYAFSDYSDALKSLMGLTQLQLNSLSVAKDVGKAFGLLAGLASDRLPPAALLLIGSLEGLLSYGVQWLVVRRSISPLPYWQMCVLLCMGGNSTTWMNTAVLVTCMRNFRRSRGPVSGVLKGFVGLSTALFTDLSASLSPDPSLLLLLLALAPAAACAAAILFLRDSSPPNDDDDDDDARCFAAINALAVAIALYLLARDLSGAAPSPAFAAGLLALLAAPAGIPIYAALRSRSRSPAARVSSDPESPLLLPKPSPSPSPWPPQPPPEEEKEEEEEEEEGNGKGLGSEHRVGEAVRRGEFWVVMGSVLVGTGTGLAVMNNLGQMGKAMGYGDGDVSVSVFVSLTSISGFFGRIASASLSEHSLKKYGTPRPVWNAASQILMAVGYVVMALALPGSLYVGSVVVGLCYGVRLAVTVPTASELFSLEHYGLIYNILILNLPLGSFLFSGLLAGILYDAEAVAAGGGNTCVGAHCYRLVFVIMGAACLVGFGLDLFLAFRTRKVYVRIYARQNLNRNKEGKKESW